MICVVVYQKRRAKLLAVISLMDSSGSKHILSDFLAARPIFRVAKSRQKTGHY